MCKILANITQMSDVASCLFSERFSSNESFQVKIKNLEGSENVKYSGKGLIYKLLLNLAYTYMSTAHLIFFLLLVVDSYERKRWMYDRKDRGQVTVTEHKEIRYGTLSQTPAAINNKHLKD
jgi:hypothetical protein